MMPNNIEIFCDELKKYVSLSKSVTFTMDGCKIHNKRSVVEFDFSEYGPTKAYVHAKKTGGDGRLVIFEQEFVVTSKSYQTFDIDINGTIKLSRPIDSVGEIVLLGFTFLTKTDIVGESIVQINWKNLISRCGKYNCLRLVKGQLFASTGGYIEKGDIIKVIETNPANAAFRDGGRVCFNNSCEITNIVIDPEAKADRSVELYVSREPSTSVHVPQPNVETNATKAIKPINENVFKHNLKPEHQLLNFSDYILYDSSSLRNFNQFIHTKDKSVKQVRSNNQSYLIIKQKGGTKATMPQLKANTNYICIINGKKLNGNGRLYIGASTNDNFAEQVFEAMFNCDFTNKYVQIKTGNEVPNVVQKLHLGMPEVACYGEILIQRIMIVEDISTDRAKACVEGKKYLPVTEVLRPSTPDVSFSFDIDICHKDDIVYEAAKKYAFYPHIQNIEHIDTTIKGTIISNNISGIVWASRIKSVIKHIIIGNIKSVRDNDALFISHLNRLNPANRIWIEPFEFDAKISKSDAIAIDAAHTVLSPSLSNVQYLRSKFKNKKIEQAHRPLPWVEPKSDEFFRFLDFVLIFERDHRSMNQLFRVWSNNLPKLVVVGARGRYPDFVIPLNEYYPYAKILYLMKMARFIIDLPENYDYHSSILDLANVMGKFILSTNWYVFDKPNGILIVQTDYKDERFIPGDNVLKQGIDKAMTIANGDINNMSNYNKTFLSQVEFLFSS